jgi:ABC-type branched-subunit amino acid transport system substrate-binding protein
VAANFATDELGAKKAAVLYDIAADYPKGLAEFFKAAFEEIHGPGSVVAFESFTTGDKDFSAQMTNIMMAGADVLFRSPVLQRGAPDRARCQRDGLDQAHPRAPTPGAAAT